MNRLMTSIPSFLSFLLVQIFRLYVTTTPGLIATTILGIEAALGKLSVGLAKVKAQHFEETGKLEAIAVGGILAPDQVISL